MSKIKYIIWIVLIGFISCNKVENYYSNGKLKEVYLVKNNKKNGLYKQFFKSGRLKEQHNYVLDKKIDSSLYFYDDTLNNIKKKLNYLKNDTILAQEFFKNGELKSIGKILPNNYKYGYWKFYDENNNKVSVLEYLSIDGKEHLNRDWRFDVNGDTLSGKGNFYVLNIEKETFNTNEQIQFYFYLQEPLFSYESESIICLPKKSLTILNSRYSGIDSIEFDTIPSLKNDDAIRSRLPANAPLNRMFLFNLSFSEPGVKIVRGFIVEKETSISFDNYKGRIRKLYFEKQIIIK